MRAAILALLLPFLLAASPPAVIEGDTQTFMDKVRILGDLLLDGNLVQSGSGFTEVPRTVTTANITLYVRSGGADSNDCLSTGAACATVQSAVDRLPKDIAHTVVIDVGDGSFAAVHVSDFDVGINGVFTLQGTLGAPTLGTGTASGTATGGSTTTIVDSGQTWTVDALIGYLALVDGEYRVVYDNTADTLYLARAYGATASGKAYSVLEQKTVLTGIEAGGLGWGPFGAYGNKAPAYFGHPASLTVKNLAVTAGTMGFSSAKNSGVQFLQCASRGPSYGFLGDYTIGRESWFDCFAGGGSGTGFTLELASGHITFDGNVSYGNSLGIKLYYLHDFEADGIALIGNSTEGAQISGGIKVDFDGATIVKDNGDHGLLFNAGVSFIDVDGGDISSNGGYGIYLLDENAVTNGTASCAISLAGNITVASNALGGIIGKNHTNIMMTNVDGSNTGYGLTLETGSHATVTSATGLTGSLGDATIDEGQHTVTWATDFAADGDKAINLGNLCVIERKD